MHVDSTARRSEGRFFINSDATEVTVSFAGPDDGEVTYRGRLADLSLRGMKVSVDGRIDSGQEVEVLIAVPGLGFQLQRQAIVRWQQPRDATTWWMGCEVCEPFGPELVEKLAAGQVLNRRRDPRYEVDKAARIRWELSDHNPDVRLVNFSKGGFCFILESPFEFPSDRLMLVITPNGDEVTIPARVMWQGPIAEGHGVGCSFSTRDGFLRLREFVESGKVPAWRMSKYRSRKVSKWVLIALYVLILLQIISLLPTTPELLGTMRAGWTARVVDPIKYGLNRLTGATEHDPPTVDETGDEASS